MHFNISKHIRTLASTAGQAAFFLILFVSLAKTPLAYTCLPNTSGPETSVASQSGSMQAPCRFKEDMSAPATGHSECCLIEVDNGLRGTEVGAPIQGQSRPDPSQPDAIAADTGPYPGNDFPLLELPLYEVRSAPPLQNQAAYLVTGRLRI